jgi:predicted dehydrogenase
MDTLDVAVIGVGRMGRHHARTYHGLAGARLAGVVDADEERAATVADAYGCAFFTSTEALLAEQRSLAAVTIAVPTARHAEAARPLLERGIACLVEKPLAPTVQDADALVQLAARHGALLQVGHTERFNPAIRAVKKMNLVARFLEVDRVSPMTFRSLDVGVVMDMMIHDLDIVLMLAASPIARVDAAGVAVLGRHEDIANARLVFENGCVANLTASRLALKTERKLRLFSESGYVSLDYASRSGMVLRRSDANVDALSAVREQLAAGRDLSELNYEDLVEIEQLTMDAQGEADPLTAELRSFLEAVRTGQAVEVDAAAGYAAVHAAHQVVEALRAHRWEGLDPLAIGR